MVPATLIAHLRKIQGQLKKLKSVVEHAPPTSADIESPDPNNTQLLIDAELELHRMIYEYSFYKVQRHFSKRGPEILGRYDDIMASLKANNIPEDTEILTVMCGLLQRIQDLLEEEKPQGSRLIVLIAAIFVMSNDWRKRLQAVEDENVLTRWDDLTGKSALAAHIYDTIAHLFFLVVRKNRKLSLRRFLQKLFSLQHHIQSILRIAWSWVQPTRPFSRDNLT